MATSFVQKPEHTAYASPRAKNLFGDPVEAQSLLAKGQDAGLNLWRVRLRYLVRSAHFCPSFCGFWPAFSSKAHAPHILSARFGVMFKKMSAVGLTQFEVFKPVVGFDVVDMVDDATCWDGAIFRLPNDTVFEGPASLPGSYFYLDVAATREPLGTYRTCFSHAGSIAQVATA